MKVDISGPEKHAINYFLHAGKKLGVSAQFIETQVLLIRLE